jgi:UDP-N-acetylglucosamine--N-acetylmuramyl-(pentapeptide) pyrophosphoryl-undecaprenol N-acetylglucosamine transferase
VSEAFVLLAAGGTGGHLFPAFALAEELGRRGIAVELATDLRGDRYGTGFPARKVHKIPSATLGSRDPMTIAKTGMTLSRGIAMAYRLLGQTRPAAVVGFGGYPSFPPLLAARMRGIPSALHEQNAVLGRANRLLAKRVTSIATSFEQVKLIDTNLLPKVRYTGNPVRQLVLDAAKTPFPTLAAGDNFKLLVFGGSQGARYFSDSVPRALTQLPEEIKSRLHVVQQAREEDLQRVHDAYTAAEIRSDVAAFFPNLPELMAASHLVIGRAGASSVAEIAVIGRPSILVPLPHALDNDQLHNAMRLADGGGAWCIPQADLSAERLVAHITHLINNPATLDAAAAAAKTQGRPDAVVRFADLVQELMGQKPVRMLAAPAA